MKPLLLITALLLFGLVFSGRIKVADIKSEANIDYNLKTDQFVRSILKTEPININVDHLNSGTIYEIRFDTCQFTICHYNLIEYQQRESWDYDCKSKSGRLIMISSPLDLKEHKISNETYKLLRDYCLNL